MKRHPTDLVSFIPGVLFVAVAITALAGGLRLDTLDSDWIWPVTLVVLGLVVLVSSGLTGRSRGADAPEATETEPAETGEIVDDEDSD